MPSQLRLKRHTPEERRRVLDAYSSGGDWRAIARYNGFPRTTAEYLVGHGRAEDLPRGGARANKVTPEIKEALETWMNECCTFTLRTLQNLVVEDINVKLSQTTISRHLIDMMYTIKQVRVEPTTCNNEMDKEKRKEFAEALIRHTVKGDLVVYFDETNYNLYTKRTRGRAKKGKRSIEKLPPSKGANLQIQCAVSSAFGGVAYRTHRGSIKMQTNADFVEGLYKVIKESDVYKDEYTDKKIDVVFDNAPAHCQTESLVTKRDDLVLLRLGPYSPMCNPIENCFSSLKAHIKAYLALMRDEMNNPVLTMNGEPISKTEARMQLLERAAHVCMTKITQRMVQKMELHAFKFVSAAVRMEDMVYGA
ncbi:hypothetical protein PC119_g6473 [Phytophthora cactorum]|uniref:Tc1-like transposase DDE domain-containing protein n=1 Tax=Phytophthora cactorum TaxID=29920 RepID=A0A8T1E772_9STRA|nr:hypothetical protein PC117_g6784 [Phytophthora cactorum]KAG3029832.1 hypothetical protein PC119_g6473 [Phytophthora cactorum]